MSLVEQLAEVYLTHESWHTKKLPYEEAIDYYEVAVRKQRIIPYLDNGNLLGYVESWVINYEQFGRILCRLPFDISKEDIEHGPICYIEGTWIEPKMRGFGRDVHRDLTQRLFEQNLHCEFFVGEAMRKQAGFVKILKRTDAIMKYLRQGAVNHG